MTTRAGRSFGFELYLGPLENVNKYNTFISRGLRLFFIHDCSFLSPSAKEILIETGKQTNIELHQTVTQKASWPHSQCQDLNDVKTESIDLLKSVSKIYRQRDCIDLCIQMVLFKNCHCIYTLLPTFKNVTDKQIQVLPCLSGSEFKCLDFYFFNLTSRNRIVDECLTQCPLECDYTTYDWSMSTLDYPSMTFFDSIRNSSKFYRNFSLEKYKESHLVLNVYYPSVDYTEIVEIPKTTFLDLIANLGGVLCIFLGFSLFSLVFSSLFLFVFIFIIL